jgi:hypothetical protein
VTPLVHRTILRLGLVALGALGASCRLHTGMPVGVHFAPQRELSRRLRESGFEEIAVPRRTVGISLGAGPRPVYLEGQIDVGETQVQRGTGGRVSHYRAAGGTLRLGYDVLDWTRGTLTPLVGLGTSGSDLRFDVPTAGIFSQPVTRASQNVAHLDLTLAVEHLVGAAPEPLFGDTALTGFSLGARLSYRHPLGHSAWQMETGEAVAGPASGLGGLFAALVLGFSSHMESASSGGLTRPTPDR